MQDPTADLTSSQAAALGELRSLTAQSSGADPSALIDILASEDWDVQRAAALIFDDGRESARRSVESAGEGAAERDAFVASTSSRPGRRMEWLEIDESAVRRRPPNRSTSSVGLNLVSYFAWPLSLLYRLASSLILFLARLLRIVPSSSSPSSSRRSRSSRKAHLDPVAAADRFVRSLEEETRALTVSRAAQREREESAGGGAISPPPRAGAMSKEKEKASRPDLVGIFARNPSPTPSSGVESRASAEAGPSSRPLILPTGGTSSSASSTKRLDGLIDPSTDEPKLLPDFFIGSYKDALELARKEIRLLCVILVSDEHEDVPEFKRRALTDPELVRRLTENNFVVWGGDVREREAYRVSTILEATTYPFIAFISLQPPRPSNPSPFRPNPAPSSTPRLAVLSRLEGSPRQATSPASLVHHIDTLLLPRTSPYLGRLRAEKRRREEERKLREEQDRAFEEASRRDAERVMRKRAEERKAREEEERKRRAEDEKKERRKRRAAWRAWAKRHLVPAEPSIVASASGEKTAKLAIRLSDGRRITRVFPGSARIEALFAFVDLESSSSSSSSSSLTASDDDLADGPPSATPPAGFANGYHFAFSLVIMGYPRRTLTLSSGAGAEPPSSVTDRATKLEDVDGLCPGATLVMERTAEDEDEDGDRAGHKDGEAK